MPCSKECTSSPNIEEDILKAIAFAKQRRHPKIADILKYFDAEKYLPKMYRPIYFSYRSLLKLILFKKLKRIQFQAQLERYFKKNRAERKKLGLPRTPDQTTISYFWTHVLSDEDKKVLTYIADTIEIISKKVGIVLDNTELQPEKPRKNTGPRNRQLRIKRKIKEISKMFHQRLLPQFEQDLKLRYNCVYDVKDHFNVLLQMERETDFAENAATTLRSQLQSMIIRCPKCESLLFPKSNWIDEDAADNVFICTRCGYEQRIAQTGETTRIRINKLRVEKIQSLFETQFEILWNMAKQCNHFKNEKVPIAFDFTDIPYYGDDETNIMIRGTQYKRSTPWCYKYLAADIVKSGSRFTVDALAQGSLDNQHDLLKQSLENIRKRGIYISIAFFDRAFFNSETIVTMNERKIPFIMPCTEYADIKKVLEKCPTPFVENGRIMKGRASYNMAVISALDENGKQIYDEEGKPVKHAFATNLPLDENNPEESANKIANEYKKRWGIETSFRMIKRTFGLWTTSDNPRLRIFYWLFSVLMYNLWILADILAWLSIYGYVGDDHLTTSKQFRLLFFLIDPGG